jgi:hypothetical protein
MPGWSGEWAHEVLSDFMIYCRDNCDEHATLLDYILRWTATDQKYHAVAHTDGNFTTFLELILVIIEGYEDDPSILDYGLRGEPNYRERRVRRLLNFDERELQFDLLDHRNFVPFARHAKALYMKSLLES